MNSNVYDVSVLELSVIRTLAWEALKEYASGKAPSVQRMKPQEETSLQIHSIMSEVYDLAVKRNISNLSRRQSGAEFTTSSYRIVGEVIWILIIAKCNTYFREVRAHTKVAIPLYAQSKQPFLVDRFPEYISIT